MKTFTFVMKDTAKEVSILTLVLREGNKKVTVSTGLKETVASWDVIKQIFNRNTPNWRVDNEVVMKWSLSLNQLLREDLLDPKPLEWVRDAAVEVITGKPSNRTDGLFLPYYKKWSTTDTTRRVATRHMMHSYRLFCEFLGTKRQKVSFNDITYSLAEEYIEWMYKRGLCPNTRGGHIKRIKTAMNDAYKEGLHKNTDFTKFRKEQEEVDNVYLTNEELQRIEMLILCGRKAQVRDLFLVGCYTAMRFSDYSRLTILDISGKYIQQVQQKTKERVIVPIHPIVREVIQRYGGAPQVHLTKFNTLIKDVCREAGIPSISIMKITGHRTEANFMKYIKVSKEENAQMLAGNAFFMG